jgi:hypothetical protein
MKIYMGGPITGVPYGDVRFGYRHVMQQKFPHAIHPLRGDSLKDLGLDDVKDIVKTTSPEDMQEIIARSKWDVTRSDVCYFNFDRHWYSSDRNGLGPCVQRSHHCPDVPGGHALASVRARRRVEGRR